jgi:hypothetical protein
MSIAGTKFFSSNFRANTICVDSYEDKQLKGRLWQGALDEEKPFNNAMQLLILLETQFSKLNCPQSFTQMRSFNSSTSAHEPTWDNTPPPHCSLSGERATFHLKVIFRQNASWQGTITWSEGKREEPFRSALELLLLIDSALSLPQSSETEDSRRLTS